MIEREQRMIEYFRNESTPVPTSIFEDRMMRQSGKSVLMKAVTRNVRGIHLMYLQYIFWVVGHCYAKVMDPKLYC